MDKIWFISIEGSREGPWSFEDLKNDTRITPDTLIWKDGFDGWKKIRDVPELKELFKDDSAEKEADGNAEDADAALKVSKPSEGELTMDIRQEPPYFLWLVIALVSLLYLILQLQR